MELYLTLRYAIKYADIGLLRFTLRHIAVVFQAEAAGTPKYANALLYLVHLTDSPASDERLQRCVLTNGLVNLQGHPTSNFELDRLLELLNNSLKCFQRDRSYFSKDSDSLLEYWALNGPYLQELKAAVKVNLGVPRSSTHTPKSAAEDIWSMALSLVLKSLHECQGDRFSKYPSPNLYIDGLRMLSKNVLKYNQQYSSEGPLSAGDEADDEVTPAKPESSDTIPPSPVMASGPPDPPDPAFVD